LQKTSHPTFLTIGIKREDASQTNITPQSINSQQEQAQIMVAEAATTETCTPTIPETKKKKLSVPPGKKYNSSLHPSYYT